MMERYIKTVLLICILSVSSITLQAKAVPELKGRVNDYAGVLNASQATELEVYLQNLEYSTSAQVVLLVVPTLEGETVESYAIKVVSQWKLGQGDRDNGVLLLVSTGDRKLRIEVGYGLEPLLTDMKCGFIIRNIIVPEFKRGDYFHGIQEGLHKIGGVITQESDITQEQLAKYNKKRKKSKSGFPFGFILFLIIWLLLFGRSGMRGRRRGSSLFWLGGSGFGSGGSFGGGGGGFGGFSGGGGSFGGGGSSGGW